MKHLDLCSGIGGFALGLGWAGFKTVGFCEIDEYCKKILAKNFPGVPIFEDIRALAAEDLNHAGINEVDIITAGYPCQPFSLAGIRAGQDDPRHLWPEVFRLLQSIRPRYAIFENVRGHITLGLDKVLSDLEAAGYSWEAFGIPSMCIGANQKRHRVWIIASTKFLGHSNSNCNNRNSFGCNMDRSVLENQEQESANHAAPTGFNVSGRRKEILCKLRTKIERIGKTANSGGTTWTPEPRVGRVANGIPNQLDRLRGLGNAVVPQIPELFGRAIMELA